MEPRIVIINERGGEETYERVPDDSEHWQELHGRTRMPQGDPVGADEVLRKVRTAMDSTA
jgi:hypothetical protein